nr:hypothetical protein [Lachnospiraceae bacterium]
MKKRGILVKGAAGLLAGLMFFTPIQAYANEAYSGIFDFTEETFQPPEGELDRETDYYINGYKDWLISSRCYDKLVERYITNKKIINKHEWEFVFNKVNPYSCYQGLEDNPLQNLKVYFDLGEYKKDQYISPIKYLAPDYETDCYICGENFDTQEVYEDYRGRSGGSYTEEFGYGAGDEVQEDE